MKTLKKIAFRLVATLLAFTLATIVGAAAAMTVEVGPVGGVLVCFPGLVILGVLVHALDYLD